MWECEECQTEQDLDPDAEEGQIIECEECGAEFEIIELETLELRQLDIAESESSDDDEWGGDGDD